MNWCKYSEKSKERYTITENTDLSALPQKVKKVFSRFIVKSNGEKEITRIETQMPISDAALCRLKERGAPYAAHKDGFLIFAADGVVTVCADEEGGLLCGLMTFLRLLDDDARFGYRLVWDHPISSFRGVKIMMPAREEIGDYQDFIDMMMYFRHNTVMIEVGGAMEYKRHPEINEGWEEYCAFMSEYSGKSKILQEETFPWRKNSIHSNNGGGSYLTQEEVRGLIAYANERGITVIPEVPCTSHCDYLLTRHPELAERPEDPYPDTFCPSNPDSYKLLFDVFDEVIEVFRPEVMNVGHDEYYSINICDRCRKRIMDVADIFAEDLTKIHDYLASKGVKTMFWCDKIMDVHQDGYGYGGALNLCYDRWDKNRPLLSIIPPTWRAREKLPKDIICMNWYWSFGEEFDKELDGFPVVLGNFRGEAMPSFRRRCGDKIAGAMCSDWGATSPVYLQRNRIYFGMVYNDRLFWDGDYDNDDPTAFVLTCKNAFAELYRYHYGPVPSRKGRYVEVLHRTDATENYREFVDGIYAGGKEYDAEYLIGNYRIAYTDGTEQTLPIYLGEQVGADGISWCGKMVGVKGGDDNPATDKARIDPRLSEATYTTCPELIDGVIWYRTLLPIAHPQKQVNSVTFERASEHAWRLETREITIC